MATPTSPPPIGGPKLDDDDVQISSNALANQEEGNAREGDYDVETVEKVYRKIDMRIIPGLSNASASICNIRASS